MYVFIPYHFDYFKKEQMSIQNNIYCTSLIGKHELQHKTTYKNMYNSVSTRH